MAFRLPLDRLKHGTTVIAQVQLARLGDERETSLLERRKSLKKLRALLSLVVTRSTAKAVRRCDHALREAGRSLGPARDETAVHDTLSRLVEMGLLSRASLVRALRKALDSIETQELSSCHDVASATIAKRIAAIDLRHVTVDTLIIAAGRSYRAARRSRTHALARRTSEAAHDWRKTVQRHARHLQLLADLWPAELEMRAAAVKEIARGLGEDHDLHVFAIWLEGVRLPHTEHGPAADLQAAIRKRQRQLRDSAFALGAKVFAERPRCLRQRFTIYAKYQFATKIMRDIG